MPNIKEIALRIGEKADEYADAKLQSKGEFHPDWHTVRDEYFAEALIESYKAELLKEVGEPVAVTNHAQLGYVTDGMHPDIPLAMWAKETSYSGANIALYTSDQVAAAILKATKTLEDQLAAAQEEIKTVTEQKNRMWFEMQTAQDQLAKAEQRVAEYNELIYAVQTKHHDETRHQTALRYIRNAEMAANSIHCAAAIRALKNEK